MKKHIFLLLITGLISINIFSMNAEEKKKVKTKALIIFINASIEKHRSVERIAAEEKKIINSLFYDTPCSGSPINLSLNQLNQNTSTEYIYFWYC